MPHRGLERLMITITLPSMQARRYVFSRLATGDRTLEGRKQVFCAPLISLVNQARCISTALGLCSRNAHKQLGAT
jgi:hypothetical protein